MSIQIRAQRDDDQPQVDNVITQAFGDDGKVARLATALRRRSDTQAGLVAVDDGRIVGHTHLSVSWIDAPGAAVEVLTLSPLSVLPVQQSQGIGSRLLLQAREAAAHLSAPLLFLEGDPGYYIARGWRPAEQLGFTPPSNRIPLPAFLVVLLDTYDSRSMHGALVYNDTFWAHDCVGLR